MSLKQINIAPDKTALYFGCWDRPGHFLHEKSGAHVYRQDQQYPSLFWTPPLMDSGLLRNGEVPDLPDGRVFWTCGGNIEFWYAFYWWDRSVDKRGACNSGFYVRGFGWPQAEDAFAFACAEFPRVVQRQIYPLVLQVKKEAAP